MCKKGKANFNNVAMFSLGRAVLLVSMRTRNMMFNAYATEERVELLILPSPVTLNCENFLVKLPFNKFLKLLEDRKNFRFILE